jgi:hypothetical protein
MGEKVSRLHFVTNWKQKPPLTLTVVFVTPIYHCKESAGDTKLVGIQGG